MAGEVYEMALAAREAAYELSLTSTEARNAALLRMADALEANAASIIEANALDMEAGRANGMTEALLDRLLLTESRIRGIAAATRELAALDDPIGEVIEERTMYNGMLLRRVRVPLGVVAVIYEARPNVTVDAAAIALKTANASILRGGSSAINSNLALTRIIARAAAEAGMPAAAIQSIESTDRAATTELMQLHGLVDVLIPRGGAGLIRNCVENSKVPVIETGTGNCHVYVHEKADFDMATRIIVNAKTQRQGVCNACESLLIDESIAADYLPQILPVMRDYKVLVHGDEATCKVAASCGFAEGVEYVSGTEEDWGTEYLGPEISVRLVNGVREAVAHINRYGTKHSESIVTADADAAAFFLAGVDAAAVYHNASTRFTDGGEFGLGAEIGISTQKLHVRGPMGLVAMTSSKYCLSGDGQVRG